MELLREHTHTHTHTHFPGLTFISKCVYVCVHVAWRRNIPVSLPSLVASVGAERERQRERESDHIHHSLFYVWTACVCVSVCECTRSPLMLKHIVHAVLICDPTLLTALTSPANHPGADGTGIYMYVYLCVSVCVLACVNALQQYNETADPQVIGPRQA